jgi:maltose O-acetyltransferase
MTVDSTTKRLIKRFASGAISRLACNFVLKSSTALRSVLSYMKTYALFPEAAAKDFYVDWTVEVGYPDRIQFGQRVRVGPDSVLGAYGGIVIGDDVRMSRGVRLETGGLDFTAPRPFPHQGRPIHIQDGAWIGTHAVILGGVTIGSGAVIGAQAVVTKDVPSNTVVAGNPAKVVKIIDRSNSTT